MYTVSRITEPLVYIVTDVISYRMQVSLLMEEMLQAMLCVNHIGQQPCIIR